MEIRYLGWESFKIREKGVTVVTQPFGEETGAFFPKTKAELVICRKIPTQKIQARIESSKRKKPFWIGGPGEYEVEGVEVWGFPGGYWFRLNDLGFVYLYQLEKGMVGKLSEDIHPIDVIFFHVSLEKKLKRVVEKISPAFLLPFCSTSVAKPDLLSFSWAQKTLDLLDQENASPKERLKVDEQELPEETRVVLLET